MKTWAGILAMAAALTTGAVELSGVFGNHMVLQRDCAVRIWGTGRPGEKLQLEFNAQRVAGVVGADGRWLLTLPPMAGNAGNQPLRVVGDNTIELRNILIGDVWLCVGQSNMEFALSRAAGGAEYQRTAADQGIRLARTPRSWQRMPSGNLKVNWNFCTPESAGKFSAVGYLAARAIREKSGVPLGLISIAWGGCRIEALCPREAFDGAGISAAVREPFKQALAELDARPDAALRPDKQRLPAVLFQAMVHPYAPMAVRGMFFYQGEDNHADGEAYAEKLRALATSWRHYFRNPALPVYVVAVAPWQYGKEDPTCLPRFWAAQRKFVESDPHAGLVMTTDCGDAADIHPTDKVTPGERLARLVLYREYGIGDESALSPVPDAIACREGRVEVTFRYANGLTTRDGKAVSHLFLAGADGVFHPATGTIRGELLSVTSPAVATPRAIRFGWNKLANSNLVNRAGVPAVPFETSIPAEAGGAR